MNHFWGFLELYMRVFVYFMFLYGIELFVKCCYYPISNLYSSKCRGCSILSNKFQYFFLLLFLHVASEANTFFVAQLWLENKIIYWYVSTFFSIKNVILSFWLFSAFLVAHTFSLIDHVKVQYISNYDT